MNKQISKQANKEVRNEKSEVNKWNLEIIFLIKIYWKINYKRSIKNKKILNFLTVNETKLAKNGEAKKDTNKRN